jgi:hypothetical protein
MKLQQLAQCAVAGALLLLAPRASSAQSKPIVLNKAEDFRVGHKMVYLELKDTIGLMSVKPGPISWDFSTLRMSGDTVYQELIALPEQYKKDFPEANLVEKKSDGSMVFTEKTAQESKVWGIERQGMTMPYSTPYVFIRRPFKLGDSIISRPDREYTMYGTQVKGSGFTRTISDGWGTLKLPAGTYEVLKLSFEQHYTDIAAGSADETKTDIVTHAWFDAKHKGALLRVSEIRIRSKYYNNTLHTTELLLSEE